MMELSSLTASVTLGIVSFGDSGASSGQVHIHELVGLLLLLENGRGGVILLAVLSARGIAASSSVSGAQGAG